MVRLLSAALVSALILPVHMQPAQQGNPMGGPRGGMGGMGGMGGPMRSREPSIPSSLPRPSEAWLASLSEVLSREVYSQRQYESDAAKYQVSRPYRVILSQEQDHIRWLRQLFAAFGVTPTVRRIPIQASSALLEAYEIGRDIETDLVARYDELVTSTTDASTRDVLGLIDQQSRHHLMMFQHALGAMDGGGRGGGDMGGGPGAP